jgi:hypothetical protein
MIDQIDDSIDTEETCADYTVKENKRFIEIEVGPKTGGDIKCTLLNEYDTYKHYSNLTGKIPFFYYYDLNEDEYFFFFHYGESNTLKQISVDTYQSTLPNKPLNVINSPVDRFLYMISFLSMQNKILEQIDAIKARLNPSLTRKFSLFTGNKIEPKISDSIDNHNPFALVVYNGG